MSNPLSFKTYITNAIPLGFNMYLDLIPISLSYQYLKHYKDTRLPSILTLLLSYDILAFGLLLGFAEVVEIRCCVHYSRDNYQKLNESFCRIVLINLLFLTGAIVLMWRSDVFLAVLHLPVDVKDDLVSLLRLILPAKVVNNFAGLLRGLLATQNIFWPFQYINTITLLLFISFLYVFMVGWKLSIHGFVIAYYLRIISELLLLAYFIYSYSDPRLFFWPSTSRVLKGYISELKFVLYVCLSAYGEWISLELNNVVLALSGNLSQITAYGLVINTMCYIYFVLYGQIGYFRILMSIEIGRADIPAIKHTMRRCFRHGYIIMVIFSVLVFFFSHKIVFIYTDDPETVEWFGKASLMYTFIICGDFTCAMLNNTNKMIRKEDLQFYLGGVCYPAMMLGFSFVFGYLMDLQLLGIMLSYLVTTYIYLFVLYLVYRRYSQPFFDRLLLKECCDSTVSLSNVWESFLTRRGADKPPITA